MNEMEDMIRKIVEEMQKNGTAPTAAPAAQQGIPDVTTADYPIAQKHPDWITFKGGMTLDDVTVDAVVAGKIKQSDLRIQPKILKAQGEIAASGGREAIKNNFDRAAEMTQVPDDRLLAMYNALRPYRSSYEELTAIADELQNTYKAVICANFVREAANQYKRRKKLKGDN